MRHSDEYYEVQRVTASMTPAQQRYYLFGELTLWCGECGLDFDAVDIDEWGDPSWTEDEVQCRDCYEAGGA